MPSRWKASHSANSTLPRTLVTPSTGSRIQKRRMKSSEDAPKALRWQTGAGLISTRSTDAARLHRQLADLVRIGVVGDAEFDIEPHLVVGIGPVDHPLGDEILVRDQEFAAVARDHRG